MLNKSRKEKKTTHPLIPETTTAVHHIEEILVFLASEPIQARNLKITPEMAHVVAFTLHGLGVDVIKVVGVRVGLQDLFRQLLLCIGRGLWLGHGLQEHLPQTLGLEVVLALVSCGVPEDVGDGLAKFFDGNGESVGLVGLGHFHERITGGHVSNWESCSKHGI